MAKTLDKVGYVKESCTSNGGTHTVIQGIVEKLIDLN